MTPKDTDTTVNHPVHYTSAPGGLEWIDAIQAAVSALPGFDGFCAGNAMKYLWRHDMKGGTEDIKKAIWYLECLMEARAVRGAK